MEILLFHHQTKDGGIAQERNYRKGKRRESDNAYFVKHKTTRVSVGL
jgi:hypothetical protein